MAIPTPLSELALGSHLVQWQGWALREPPASASTWQDSLGAAPMVPSRNTLTVSLFPNPCRFSTAHRTVSKSLAYTPDPTHSPFHLCLLPKLCSTTSLGPCPCCVLCLACLPQPHLSKSCSNVTFF